MSPYRLSDEQYRAVRALPVRKRYEHLIKRAADSGEVWALASDRGWVVGADDDGREFVPVWPHPRYAEDEATGDWEDSTPALIDVHDWLGTWTPNLVIDKRLVGVFPVRGQEQAVIEPSEFAVDLRDELSLMD